MEGKRFGMGIAAGLLLGFAVIAASGGIGVLSPGLMSPSFQSGSAVTTLSNQAVTTIVTASATTSVPTKAAVGNLSGASTTTTSANPSSTTPNSNQSDLISFASNGANGAPPGPSSRVQSIANQSLFVDALVFLPILVALLLGAILYSASNRGSEQPSEAPP